MTERAEGFWWVRVSDKADVWARAALPTGWSVACVNHQGEVFLAFGASPDFQGRYDEDWPGWEWGPYLGKEPGVCPRCEAIANAQGLTTKPYKMPDPEREREAWKRLSAKFPGLHAK